jgi:hypothetical protein
MKFQNKIGIHTRKIHRKNLKKSKKSKPKTRRFYYRKLQCKQKLTDGGGFTDITETDILRPLKQKAGDLQIEPYAKGIPKFAPFEKDKPDEKENKDVNTDKSKEIPLTEEKKMNTHDYGIDSLVIKDNKNIDTVNDFFRQMLEIESKWERKFIEHKEFHLPNTVSEKKNNILKPKMEYKVSVLQNQNQENKNYLEPVFDIKKTPNQTLETLNDVIPAVTGDEIIEYENKNPERNQPQIDKIFIESKLKPLLIQKKTETLPETLPKISPEKTVPIQDKTKTSSETFTEKTQEEKEDELLNETSLALLLSLINAAKETEKSQEQKSKPLSNYAYESEIKTEPEQNTEELVEELVASAILAAKNQ